MRGRGNGSLVSSAPTATSQRHRNLTEQLGRASLSVSCGWLSSPEWPRGLNLKFTLRWARRKTRRGGERRKAINSIGQIFMVSSAFFCLRSLSCSLAFFSCLSSSSANAPYNVAWSDLLASLFVLPACAHIKHLECIYRAVERLFKFHWNFITILMCIYVGSLDAWRHWA